MNQVISQSALKRGLLVAALASGLFGCAKDQPAKEPVAASEPAETFPNKEPEKSDIAISPTIAKACGITETDAFFSYNSAKVSSGADAIFTKLAECFTKGPLAGKTMSLVGHCDPRGEDEYNFTLAGKRADNVAAAIKNKGLPAAQAQTTSRGEMDAKGTDDASWAADRKVEINLAE